MATGYSGTPLTAKLGYKPGMQALIVGAPAEYFDWLEGEPQAVSFITRRSAKPGSVGLLHLFTTSAGELASELPQLLPLLEGRGSLWVSWPKKAMAKKLGIETDITEDRIRDIALPLGIVDVKVCAVS